MSYTPTNWQTGDTITAEKLNKLEGGVASGAMIVNITPSTHVLDKTFTEIYQAINNGIPVYLSVADPSSTPTGYSNMTFLMPVVAVYKYNQEYRIFATCVSNQSDFNGLYYLGGSAVYTFSANSAADYPTFLRRVIYDILSDHTLAGYIRTDFSF